MIRLSDHSRGEELQEKLEVLEKMYKKLKKSNDEDNFFENFKKKYLSQVSEGSPDVADFINSLQQQCDSHRSYLKTLVDNASKETNPRRNNLVSLPTIENYALGD